MRLSVLRSAAQTPADPVRDLLDSAADALPEVLAAALIVAGGLLVAWLLRTVTVRLVTPWGARVARSAGRLLRNRDVEEGLKATTSDKTVGATLGAIVYWIVLLFFLAAATEALGLGVISLWLSGAAGYLPRAIATVAVVLLSVVLATIVRSAVTRAAAGSGLGYADAIGRLAQTLIVLVGVVVAIQQLGLEVTFLVVLAAVIAGALLGGAALAFGLGSQTVVSNIIASHYLTRIYRVGHRVRVDGVEGLILEITPVAVVVGTDDGRVVVPSKVFSEQTTTLLAQ